MRRRSELEDALHRVLDVLDEYADDLILIGGWVPHIHLTHGRPAVEDARTSLTTEADLLVPARMLRGDRRSIAEVLRAAGFTSRAEGVVWFREPAKGGEKIEFLKVLKGPATRRGSPGPVPDQPELRALALDHLQVMEEFNETVLIPRPHSGAQRAVRVPTLWRVCCEQGEHVSSARW